MVTGVPVVKPPKTPLKISNLSASRLAVEIAPAGRRFVSWAAMKFRAGPFFKLVVLNFREGHDGDEIPGKFLVVGGGEKELLRVAAPFRR